MKLNYSIIISISALLTIPNHIFSQFGNTPSLNIADLSTGGKIGIGTGAPAAKLDVLSVNNQLRLSYSSTIFSDIQTTSAGNLIFKPNNTSGKIGFGNFTTIPQANFHINLGSFYITDPLSTTRGLQILPSRTVNGEIPAGSTLVSSITTANEGLSIASGGTGAVGVKLGAYAYSSSGWKSIWETANVSGLGVLPNLLLVKSGGNVGIGTTTPGAKLEIAGQIKITGGTPGIGKVLTSDASGLASWVTPTGILSGGTGNYIPRWNAAGNSLSSTSTIYDNGNFVGIGTDAPTERLQLGDRFVFHDGGNKYIGYNTHFDGTNNVRLKEDYASSISFGGGDINFQTDASSTPGSIINGTTRFVIKNTGEIGIGTNTPYKKLTVVGDAAFGSSDFKNALEILSNDQVPSRRGISLDNDPSGKFNFYVHSYQSNASFNFKNSLNNSTVVSINAFGRTDINAATNTDKYFVINDVSVSGSPVETFAINGDGSAHFGKQKIIASHTHANAQYQFDGKIACKELVVVDPVKWADFVFDKTYKLLPLTEVEAFYLKNKHLPSVPSEADVKQNGINTSEMDATLLQKIEELTLYLVQQQKEIDALKKQIKP